MLPTTSTRLSTATAKTRCRSKLATDEAVDQFHPKRSVTADAQRNNFKPRARAVRLPERFLQRFHEAPPSLLTSQDRNRVSDKLKAPARAARLCFCADSVT